MSQNNSQQPQSQAQDQAQESTQLAAAREAIKANEKIQEAIRSKIKNFIRASRDNTGSGQFLLTEKQLAKVFEDVKTGTGWLQLTNASESQPATSKSESQSTDTPFDQALKETLQDIALDEVKQYIKEKRDQWLAKLKDQESLLELRDIVTRYLSNEQINQMAVENITNIAVSAQPDRGACANLGFLDYLITQVTTGLNDQNAAVVNTLIQAMATGTNYCFLDWSKSYIDGEFTFMQGLYNIVSKLKSVSPENNITTNVKVPTSKMAITNIANLIQNIHTQRTAPASIALVYECDRLVCEANTCQERCFGALSRIFYWFNEHKLLSTVRPNFTLFSSLVYHSDLFTRALDYCSQANNSNDNANKKAYVKNILQNTRQLNVNELPAIFESLYDVITLVSADVARLLTQSKPPAEDTLENLAATCEQIAHEIFYNYEIELPRALGQCNRTFAQISVDNDAAMAEKKLIHQIAKDIVGDTDNIGLYASMKNMLMDAGAAFRSYYDQMKDKEGEADPKFFKLSKAFANYIDDNNCDNLLALLDILTESIEVLPDWETLSGLANSENISQNSNQRALYSLVESPLLGRARAFLDHAQYDNFFGRNLQRLQCAIKILKAPSPEIAQQYMDGLVEKVSHSSILTTTVVTLSNDQRESHRDILSTVNSPETEVLPSKVQTQLDNAISNSYLENKAAIIKEQRLKADGETIIIVADKEQQTSMQSILGEEFLKRYHCEILISDEIEKGQCKQTIRNILKGTKVFCLDVPSKEVLIALEPQGVNIKPIISDYDCANLKNLRFDGQPPRSVGDSIALVHNLHLTRNQKDELHSIFGQLEAKIPDKNAHPHNCEILSFTSSVIQYVMSCSFLDDLNDNQILDVIRILIEYPKACSCAYQRLLSDSIEFEDMADLSDTQLSNAKQLFMICSDQQTRQELSKVIKQAVPPNTASRAIRKHLEGCLSLYQNATSDKHSMLKHFKLLKDQKKLSEIVEHREQFISCCRNIKDGDSYYDIVNRSKKFANLNLAEKMYITELYKIARTPVYSDYTLVRWAQRLGWAAMTPAVTSDDITKLCDLISLQPAKASQNQMSL